MQLDITEHVTSLSCLHQPSRPWSSKKLKSLAPPTLHDKRELSLSLSKELIHITTAWTKDNDLLIVPKTGEPIQDIPWICLNGQILHLINYFILIFLAICHRLFRFFNR